MTSYGEASLVVSSKQKVILRLYLCCVLFLVMMGLGCVVLVCTTPI